MIRHAMTCCGFLLALSLSSALAETYTWTDEQGTVHFTEDPGTVPRKMRNKVRSLDDTVSPPAASPAAKTPGAGTSEAAPAPGKGEAAAGELYAGKTYEQWKKELADREAAMTAVRQRIDEIVVMVKKPAGRRDEQQRLIAEHTSLIERFNDMKKQYNQQVEIARKAGLQVNIQQ